MVVVGSALRVVALADMIMPGPAPRAARPGVEEDRDEKPTTSTGLPPRRSPIVTSLGA